jgi:HEAT repeat protein
MTLVASLHIVVSEGQEANSVISDESPTVALDEAAVAVLPFEVLSTDPKVSELAAALHEAISRALSGINGLRVVDPGRVLPFADSGFDPGDIARELGVGGIMAGTLRTFEGKWSAFLSVPGGTMAFFDLGDAASDTLSNERIQSAAAKVAERAEGAAFPGRYPTQQQVIQQMRAKVLDSSLPDGERVEALNEFPLVKNAGQGQVERRTEILGGYVAETIAQIALDAEDSIVRVRAWNGLTGLRDPGLICPLLASFANDKDVRVRKAAADRLVEGFLDEAEVKAALEFAVENDASEEVRNHIRFALSSDEEKQNELRAVALDSGKSDRERVVAIGLLLRDFQGMDRDVTVAALEIARYSDSSFLKSYAWGFLSESRDPYLVEPYLELLATDPNEEVRETVASGLGKFLDYPGVREALDAATHDSSIVIRHAATKSLQGS